MKSQVFEGLIANTVIRHIFSFILNYFSCLASVSAPGAKLWEKPVVSVAESTADVSRVRSAHYNPTIQNKLASKIIPLRKAPPETTSTVQIWVASQLSCSRSIKHKFPITLDTVRIDIVRVTSESWQIIYTRPIAIAICRDSVICALYKTLSDYLFAWFSVKLALPWSINYYTMYVFIIWKLNQMS